MSRTVVSPPRVRQGSRPVQTGQTGLTHRTHCLRLTVALGQPGLRGQTRQSQDPGESVESEEHLAPPVELGITGQPPSLTAL